jgi:hypothetical protein
MDMNIKEQVQALVDRYSPSLAEKGIKNIAARVIEIIAVRNFDILFHFLFEFVQAYAKRKKNIP